jgi:hypothetical protein
MFGAVLTALGRDPLTRAREQLVDAIRARELLTDELAGSRAIFDETGSDDAASKVQRLTMRLERADRLERQAQAAVVAAEHNAKIDDLEASARRVLGEEDEARAESVARTAKLTTSIATAIDTMTDLEKSIAIAKASAAAARSHPAARAIEDLGDVAPDRAAQLEAENRTRSAAWKASEDERRRALIELCVRLGQLGEVAYAEAREAVHYDWETSQILRAHPEFSAPAARALRTHLIRNE